MPGLFHILKWLQFAKNVKLNCSWGKSSHLFFLWQIVAFKIVERLFGMMTKTGQAPGHKSIYTYKYIYIDSLFAWTRVVIEGIKKNENRLKTQPFCFYDKENVFFSVLICQYLWFANIFTAGKSIKCAHKYFNVIELRNLPDTQCPFVRSDRIVIHGPLIGWKKLHFKLLKRREYLMRNSGQMRGFATADSIVAGSFNVSIALR